MSETIPPIGGNPSPPKTSTLAIWSLVLGILSLACFSIFAAIPGIICGHKALSRIKHSGGTIAGHGLAIAGLVTGYIGLALAIVFVPMMLAIAIPNFVKARSAAQMNACVNNLRQIDAAKQQWALENKKRTTDIPTESELAPYLNLKGGPMGPMLKCPAGGNYNLHAAGVKPTCSILGHKIEQQRDFADKCDSVNTSASGDWVWGRRRKDEAQEAFIQRAKANPIARRVKLAHLEDNMDIR